MRRSLTFALGITFLFISACSQKEITSENIEQKEIPVRTVEVSQVDISNRIHLNGQAYPAVQIPLVSPSALQIEKVHVKNGERVEKGQTLITLDDELAREQVNQAKKAVTELENAISKAKEMASAEDDGQLQELRAEYNEALKRSRALLDGLQSGAVTSLDLLQSTLEVTLKQAQLTSAAGQLQQLPQVNITQLEGQLSQARLNLKQAEKGLEATEINAPDNGIVSDLTAVENGIATPGNPLGMIVQLDEMSIVFPVNSYQIGNLKPGMQAVISFEGLEEEFTSILEAIPPTVNQQTNMFHVTIPLNNPDFIIKGGMKAEAEVKIETIQNALVIPDKALLYEEDKTFVFTVENGESVRKEVSLGFQSEDGTQVTSGLNKGDIVITDGKERVSDGSKIIIKSE